MRLTHFEAPDDKMTTVEDQDDAGVFSVMLALLREESEKDGGAASLHSEAYRAALSTMLRLLKNVVQNPSEEKYRRIRLGNKAFAEKVWKFEGAQQFLQAAGWLVLDDCIVLTEESSARPAIEELEQELRRVQPAGEETPQQTPSSSSQTLNKEITDSRKRQIEALKREKEEKRRIAEQIQADRQEIRARPMRDSRARERRFGANIKRFEDIGVDLNGGGG